MEYREFIETKFKFSKSYGFEINKHIINPLLKQHQKDIVHWAIKKGRAAIFASFGLGKSFIQTEILRIIHLTESGRHLIIAPLGVRQEFLRDGKRLNVDYKFIRKTEDVGEDGFYITNYESVRDGKLDVNLFTSVSLDEASVLRSYGSKTYQEFLPLFDDIKYRFVATATPSPNRYKELIHYAGFLGVMDTGQALTRFFQRDSSKANNLTLYPHMEKEFFTWLHSWAIFLQKPSDLGHCDDGYELPAIKVFYHEVSTDLYSGKEDRDGQMQMIKDAAMGLKDAATEKREGIPQRIEQMMGIINNDPDSHYIIWHDLESERHAINQALKEAVDVFGSQDLEIREQRIIDFSDGKFKYLSTKPEIAGSGCNFQRHCHKAIFLGIGYKFNDFIQAIHRIHRFLQTKQVEIHIIYSQNERLILKSLQKKWSEDDNLREKMTEIIKENGLCTTGLEKELSRGIGMKRQEIKGSLFTAINNDCVEETKSMQSNSIDLIHTSIPFGNHYEYSANYNDFGHNEDNPSFFNQMDYLTPELLRILKPGRVAAIHVKDRIRFGNVTGYGMPSVDPFHSDCIVHYRKHGFVYFGMITVVTDVVRENNQTYRLGWTENCKDGSKMGVGSPEYILLFRKLPTDTSRAYADVKVAKSKEEYSRGRWQIDAHSFWRSSGDRLLTSEELQGYAPDKIGKIFSQRSLETIYDYKQHVKIAETLDNKGSLPTKFMAVAPGSHDDDVWHDVNRMITLNAEQSKRSLEKHICPLQLDIIERIITRFSNKDELVFDPFGGIMSVPYMALKLGRRGIATELNTSYFKDGVRNLKLIENKISMPSLFDFEEIA